MNNKSCQSFICAVALLAIALGPSPALASSQQSEDQAQARVFLKEGVQAHKSAKFDEAIEDFKQAEQLDPSLMEARLHLASAYATQCVPGSLSVESIRMCERVVPEYREILEKDPDNLEAIDGIASMLYKVACMPKTWPRPLFDPHEMDESRSFRERHIQIKPDDPEPYYEIGKIEWKIAWDGDLQFHPEWAMDSSQPMHDLPLVEDARRKFAEQYRRTIDAGIERLNKAVALRPKYSEAWGCLSLLYLLRADTEPTPELRASDQEESSQASERAQGTTDKKPGQENSQ